LLFAIRLVLDPTLPDSARQLKLSDFWDGCDLTRNSQIEGHLDFADFDGDDALIASPAPPMRPARHSTSIRRRAWHRFCRRTAAICSSCVHRWRRMK
jgi:hypothetical protein